MKDFFDNIYNSADFFLRKNIRFSRRGYKVENEDKTEFLKSLSPLAFALEKDFVAKYELNDFKNNSTVLNYAENLYIIELLSQNLKAFSEKAKILDIGSKDWFYAVGEYEFFSSMATIICLNGIEIDGFRVYSNLYSRYDVAQHHIKNLSGSNYIVEDFLQHKGSYDYITWFFPFLTPFPLLRWGLPLKYLKPEKMLEHAYDLLKVGGEMIILNQDEKERMLQQNLLIKMGIPFEDKGEFKSEFFEYENKRFVFKVKK